MFCQNCGHQLPEFARFCTHCGAPQAGAAQGGPLAGQNEAPPQQPYTQQPYTQQQYTQQQPNTQQQQPQQPYTQEQTRQQTQQQQAWAANEKAFKQYIGSSPYVFFVLCLLTVVFGFMIVLPEMENLAVLVAFLAGMVAIVSGIIWITIKMRIQRHVSVLKSAGTYEEMLREFATSSPELGGKVRYSQSFIWGRRYGGVFDFRDICWAYRYIGRYYRIPVASSMMIGSQEGEIVPLCKLSRGSKAGNEELAVLAVLIRSKNPDVMLGYSVETIAEYKKRTKKKRAR